MLALRQEDGERLLAYVVGCLERGDRPLVNDAHGIGIRVSADQMANLVNLVQRRPDLQQLVDQRRKERIDQVMAPYRARRRANLLRKYPWMRGLP